MFGINKKLVKTWQRMWWVLWIVMAICGWIYLVGCGGGGGESKSTPQQRAYTTTFCYLFAAKYHACRDISATLKWVNENKGKYKPIGNVEETFRKINTDPDVELWVDNHLKTPTNVRYYLDKGYLVSVSYRLNETENHTIIIQRMEAGTKAVAIDLSTNGILPYTFDLAKWEIVQIETSFFANIGPLT